MHQLLPIFDQQLMQAIFLPLTFLDGFGRQFQEVSAGLEEAAGVAGRLGSFHLVPCEDPDFQASRVQRFNGLCCLILESVRDTRTSR